jgi:hypothetical protein
MQLPFAPVRWGPGRPTEPVDPTWQLAYSDQWSTWYWWNVLTRKTSWTDPEAAAVDIGP